VPGARPPGTPWRDSAPAALGVDGTSSAPRFATELGAWVATPCALAGHSWLLAAPSVLLLTGLPTLFSTPRNKADVIIAVPGRVTVLPVPLQLAEAVVFSWPARPARAAAPVTLPAAATLVTERPRRRWQLSAHRSAD
jgi:hypothetical protein